MLTVDPPWLSRARSAAWYDYEAELASASALLDGDAARTYATRVGRETVKTPREAAQDARQLAFTGLGRLVEATSACARVPLKSSMLLNFEPIYTVPGACMQALDLARTSLELRTPPSEWTSPPPIQLFED